GHENGLCMQDNFSAERCVLAGSWIALPCGLVAKPRETAPKVDLAHVLPDVAEKGRAVDGGWHRPAEVIDAPFNNAAQLFQIERNGEHIQGAKDSEDSERCQDESLAQTHRP